ncbi:MAG: hypothetical protein WC368_09025 [Candidatus Cloacimonadaceae bacterium]|nr:hypothetical protein [Candidatus Cloacimonadota bacterium]
MQFALEQSHCQTLIAMPVTWSVFQMTKSMSTPSPIKVKSAGLGDRNLILLIGLMSS